MDPYIGESYFHCIESEGISIHTGTSLQGPHSPPAVITNDPLERLSVNGTWIPEKKEVKKEDDRPRYHR